MSPRPLLKHIRDHSFVFTELARLRDSTIAKMGLKGYQFHKTPKFYGPNGERLTVEPERSIVLPQLTMLENVRPILHEALPQLTAVEHSEVGYRYPTAALAGNDAPFIKRLRSEYFHKVDEDRSICRPVNLSYGIKSRGKADNRQEYEVWMPEDNPTLDPLPLFIERYGEDLPFDVRQFIQQPARVYGWMGVKRAAFEAIYYNPSELGDIAVCVALSVDAYNIGARPDLSYCEEAQSSIARSNAELEWEIDGYYVPDNAYFSHDEIWHAINSTLTALATPLEQHYQNDILPVKESKTERILSTVSSLGMTDRDIEQIDLQAWEFMQTTSERRVKAHDPNRRVNFLGRLNRLFYQPEHQLPSIEYIHDLIS
ncbi:hypothetical protein [Alteromonas lipotrueiana]|uniref:hypothetical protein n=1 Tax=Alteromonas lipotrueiana TaxID=2803815 RepID=UPI001C479A82|nr:hypothetical protein [Alteromonas lipotrueiana]